MRQRKEIEKKLLDYYDKRLKLRIKKYLKRSYMNCCYNERCFVDNITNKVGCCTKKELHKDDKITLCNIDSKALECKFYKNKNNRQTIEEQFIADISDPKICGQKEPKIAVLLWVLHGNKLFPEAKNIGVLKTIWNKLIGKKNRNGFV